MSARTKARKRALDILYAAELRGESPVAALDAAIAAGEGPTNPYTDVLVRGVSEHRPRIDELLTEYSQGWTLKRMPAVDRNVLRHRRLSSCSTSTTCPTRWPSTRRSALVRSLSTDDSPGVRQRGPGRDDARQGRDPRLRLHLGGDLRPRPVA